MRESRVHQGRQTASWLVGMVVLVTTGFVPVAGGQTPPPAREVARGSCPGCESGLISSMLPPPRMGLSTPGALPLPGALPTSGGNLPPPKPVLPLPDPVTPPPGPGTVPTPEFPIGPLPPTAVPLPSPFAPPPPGPIIPPDLLANDCGCCNRPACVPGRKPCCPWEADTLIGRFFCSLYACICCPDPCYEGRWIPLADSAFFVEGVRPVIQTRLRWDSGPGVVVPDRSEFFWARADGMGKGPAPKAPFRGETGLRHNDLVMITEGGTGALSIVTETLYRDLQAEQFGHAAGFGDMSIGTKTLMFDCELIQVAFMLKTFIPIGNVRKGLGVGHVSMEPTGLVGIKLSPSTYFQGQVSEWIPIGGDPAYQGSILHYHFSLNQILWQPLPDVPLIGTAEFMGYSFQDGAYTDPVFGSYQKSSGYTYAYGGGGMRLFICDKFDCGMGVMLSLSEQHWGRQLYRAEFRMRF